MARKHLKMKKIKEIMRLKWECGCSHRAIARSIGVSDSTVGDCIERIQMADLSWPLPDELTDEQLETKLYPPKIKLDAEKKGSIDWEMIHKELKRKNVTIKLLWREYKEKYPEGLRYSQFCNLYRDWRKIKDVWMRQTHKAGEKLFVDYAGHTIPIIDQETGEIKESQIFVATLGASNYTFAEATATQSLPEWIQSHIHAFEFFGGCTEILVPDNLKSGVTKPHRYEPDINSSYHDMAAHYGVAIIPARVKTPKDKSKVENGVLQVEQQVLARLRNRKFFSLMELNQAIKPLLDELNQGAFQKMTGSRLSQFLEIDKPALKPLPATRYQYAAWKKVKAGLNYHIELEKHHYSVPFTLVKEELHVRYNNRTVEIFHHNNRIASHIRSFVINGYTTDKLHMPANHLHQIEWTPERIETWAEKIGIETAHFVKALMASRQHPQQGFKACMGILRFEKSYGKERLEAACKRACALGTYSYKSIESILKNNLDGKPLPGDLLSSSKTPFKSHEYVRGQHYYQ
jgi:transposase